MFPTDILLHSMTVALSSHHQKVFLPKHMRVDAENHSQVLWREREPKLEVFIGSFLLEIWKPYERVGGKIIGSRGHGGHQDNMAH